MADLIKYAIIVISLGAYYVYVPFVQKYFQSGRYAWFPEGMRKITGSLSAECADLPELFPKVLLAS